MTNPAPVGYPPAVAGTTFTYGPKGARRTCRVLFTALDPDGTTTHVRYVVTAPSPATSGMALVTMAQWSALWDHTDAIQPAAYAPPKPTPNPGTYA